MDFETEPFDNTKSADLVKPFLAVLYSDDFDPIIIWDENSNRFIERVIAAIERLPKRYIIYAHNGGKFDYMFFIHKLRGLVQFKGRGIMSATVGHCELRDSFHIIPERLANFQKDKFDYEKLRKISRAKWREEIITYCLNDCKYLLDIIKEFVQNFGFKISIGQAAIGELRKHYTVDRISEYQDGGTDGKSGLRNYFFGGRVECLAGRGIFRGPYKLYDVNSMYSDAMANCQHPVGNEYAPRRGDPNAYTAFIKLRCRNFGAFVARGEDGETTADYADGIFHVSKFEYDVAIKYGLIDEVEIISCIDCNRWSDFSKFVLPLYAKRLETKSRLEELRKMGRVGTNEWFEVLKDDIFIKLLLNNCYGKFAQNPRRFMERFITDLGVRPPAIMGELQWPELPRAETNEYALWERESRPWKFFNVGTGASITGAARAKLLDGIQNADDPIYCDTDSIICRDLRNVDIDKTRLGAWDIEAEFSECIVAGKKLYACRSPALSLDTKDVIKIRSKGVAGLDWATMQRLLDDEIITAKNKGVTLSASHEPYYMSRRVRATAPIQSTVNYHERQTLIKARN